MKQATTKNADIICISEKFMYWGKDQEQGNCKIEDIQKYFCACNQAGEGNCGNTRIISFKGKVISNIENEEGIIVEEITLEEQRKYRKEFPVLEQMK